MVRSHEYLLHCYRSKSNKKNVERGYNVEEKLHLLITRFHLAFLPFNLLTCFERAKDAADKEDLISNDDDGVIVTMVI